MFHHFSSVSCFVCMVLNSDICCTKDWFVYNPTKIHLHPPHPSIILNVLRCTKITLRFQGKTHFFNWYLGLVTFMVFLGVAENSTIYSMTWLQKFSNVCQIKLTNWAVERVALAIKTWLYIGFDPHEDECSKHFSHNCLDLPHARPCTSNWRSFWVSP